MCVCVWGGGYAFPNLAHRQKWREVYLPAVEKRDLRTLNLLKQGHQVIVHVPTVGGVCGEATASIVHSDREQTTLLRQVRWGELPEAAAPAQGPRQVVARPKWKNGHGRTVKRPR